jgi:hypothetical protein
VKTASISMLLSHQLRCSMTLSYQVSNTVPVARWFQSGCTCHRGTVCRIVCQTNFAHVIVTCDEVPPLNGFISPKFQCVTHCDSAADTVGSCQQRLPSRHGDAWPSLAATRCAWRQLQLEVHRLRPDGYQYPSIPYASSSRGPHPVAHSCHPGYPASQVDAQVVIMVHLLP